MKILVLSDSHSSLRFMRRAIECVKPDAVVHLGDYYDDGLAMSEEYPHIPMYLLPGNCDSRRCPPGIPEIVIQKVCGVELYMTHGHRHMVKASQFLLIRDAKASHADAALYGHTHVPDCRFEDGLWVLNPGSSGYAGGSAGLIETQDGAITGCSLLRADDLEG